MLGNRQKKKMAEFKPKDKGIINLQDIKSKYILERIFSFLKEKQKLNMIIYNKKIQGIIGIGTEYFKKASGKYKIGEKNGEGKEYRLETNELIFEGEYIKGKRNGKGKEYYTDEKLRFDGKYLNGKRNGKGKEYYSEGSLLFDGEYLNGKIWNGKGYNLKREIEFTINEGKGYVKEYNNYNGKLIYEGNYLNGERNAKGKEYYDNGSLLFEGEYLNGERNGKGKEYYWKGGIRLEGEYLNGKIWYGQGFNIKGELEFTINEGKGYVKEYNNYNGELIFEGEYLNGIKWNGKGKEYYDNDNLKGDDDEILSKYLKEKYGMKDSEINESNQFLDLDLAIDRSDDEFNINKRMEQIEIYDEPMPDFEDYNYIDELELKENEMQIKKKDRDKLNKKEEKYYKLHIKFEGEYLNGIRNGKGKEYDFKGNLEYEGEFLNGIRNGKGKEYYENKELKYEGEYLNGKRHGKGKEYYDNEHLKYKGDYLNGKKHGKGKEYYYSGELLFEGEYINGEWGKRMMI